MPGGRGTGLALLCTLAACAAVATAGPRPAWAAATEPTCATARADLERGQLSSARTAYLDVLAADPSSACAVTGLNETTRQEREAQRHCSAGDALAEQGRAEEAQREYAAALRTNVESACAADGMKRLGDDGTWVGDTVDYLPKVSDALTAILVVVAVVVTAIAVIVLVRALLRGRRPSLVINPLGDGGMDPPFGAAMTALLQQDLIALGGRARGASGELELDFVVADVELMSAGNDLGKAFTDIAAIPNLEFIASIAAIVERIARRERVVVTGEVLPTGARGAGLALAVGDRDAVRARQTLWAGPARAVARSGRRSARAPDETPDAERYYGLVERAASWVQYAAANQLDGRVELITTSAESFAQLGEALALHRAGTLVAAAGAYRRALALDPENVAALVNLAVLYARTPGGEAFVGLLLELALAAVVRRHATVGQPA